MVSSRQLTARASARRLVESLEWPPKGAERDRLRETGLKALVAEVTRLSEEPPAAWLVEVGGRTRLDNARHVLGMPLLRESGSSNYDRCGPLSMNQEYCGADCGVGDVAAMLMKGREGLSTLDQSLMLGALLSNLADCVDPDGFQVCADGVSQRLLGAGQGYLKEIQIDDATPREVFTLKCQEFDTNLGEVAPRPDQLSTFYRSTLSELPQLRDDLIGFLKQQYDWKPASTVSWS
jgi:hypothetical protein